MVRTCFHISNRPWIRCDAYTKYILIVKETVPKWRDARIARAHRNSLNFKLRVLIIARTDLRKKKRFIERVLKEFSREPYLCFLESFVPFRVYRFTEFEVFWSSTVPFTAHEHFLATTTGEKYELVFALSCRFVF